MRNRFSHKSSVYGPYTRKLKHQLVKSHIQWEKKHDTRKNVSQREEKVLRTGWKRDGRKRTWGDQVETTTAGPRASDSPTEGTTAPHTTFQVQFQ